MISKGVIMKQLIIHLPNDFQIKDKNIG